MVYTATAEPDVTGDEIVWSLSGADATLFRIDDGVVRFADDHITRPGSDCAARLQLYRNRDHAG